MYDWRGLFWFFYATGKGEKRAAWKMEPQGIGRTQTAQLTVCQYRAWLSPGNYTLCDVVSSQRSDTVS